MEQGAGVVSVLKRVQKGGRVGGQKEGGKGCLGVPSDRMRWRLANDSRGRWREPSPMTTQPEPPSCSQRRMETDEKGAESRKTAKKRAREVWESWPFGCTVTKVVIRWARFIRFIYTVLGYYISDNYNFYSTKFPK